jgi:serine protease Do/serine protease DegQ
METPSQPVTEELARSFGLKKARGALVADVMKQSPAEVAGLRQGDVIISLAGTEVKDSQHLQRLVGEAPAGKPLEMVVARDGKELKLSVNLVRTDSPQALNAVPSQDDQTWLGLQVEELPPKLKQRGLRGVLVADLDPGGEAAAAGLERGDLIIAINRAGIDGVAAYQKAMRQAQQTNAVTLLVKRGGSSIYFALRPGGHR